MKGLPEQLQAPASSEEDVAALRMMKQLDLRYVTLCFFRLFHFRGGLDFFCD